MTNLLVIGSLNMDLEIDVPYFPKAGETLKGSHLTTSYGGKGANQAVAAARLGATTSMLGAIGDDNYGQAMKSNLAKNKVNTDFIIEKHQTPSGMAFITRSPENNIIILSAGANEALRPPDILLAESAIKNADIILLQLEIPLQTIARAIEIGKKYNKTIILNPAPAQSLSEELLVHVDYIIPNEHEIFSFAQDPSQTREDIIMSSPHSIIMTYGAKGVLYRKKGTLIHSPIQSVEARDTTGAGDTFCGAFCTFLAEYGLEKSIEHAQHAAALTITKKGAQGGMPYLHELNLLA